MKNKIFLLLLVLILNMFQFNVCGAESAVLASADFSNGTTNNLKYWGGTSAGGGIVLNSDIAPTG